MSSAAKTSQVDQLLNPTTEHELQENFGQSVLPPRAEGSNITTVRRLGRQVATDFSRATHAVRKQATAGYPRSWLQLKSALLGLFPVINTLRTYKSSYLAGDMSAGIAEGIMKVPQGDIVLTARDK